VLEDHYRAILTELGENPDREGLLRTPYRAQEAMKFLTKGYHQNLDELLNNAIFEEDYDDMVIVRDIEFYSLCEHHLLPFYGRAHVAYIPNGKIVGISKVARIVDMFARRLQVQERLTSEIAKAMQEALDPLGVAVVTEAKHMCMLMRGVEKQNSMVTSSHVLGQFREDRATRSEFMRLLEMRAAGCL
jgi:GTP cyclohydrolase I